MDPFTHKMFKNLHFKEILKHSVKLLIFSVNTEKSNKYLLISVYTLILRLFYNKQIF